MIALINAWFAINSSRQMRSIKMKQKVHSQNSARIA